MGNKRLTLLFVSGVFVSVVLFIVRLVADHNMESVNRKQELGEKPHTEVMRSKESDVRTLCVSGDGQWLASGRADSTIQILRLPSLQRVAVLKGYGDWITHLAFSTNGRYLVSGDAGARLAVWDTTTWRKLTDLRMAVDASLSGIAIIDNDRKLAALGYESMTVWSLGDGSMVHSTDRFGGYSLAFVARHGLLVAGGGWGALSFIDELSLKGGAVLPAHKGNVFSMVGRDNYLVSGGLDGAVCLWSFPDKRLERKWVAHSAPVLAVALSPNADSIASGGSDRKAMIWTLRPDGAQQELTHDDIVSSVVFDGTGETLFTASGKGNKIHLWDVKTRKRLRVLGED